MAHYGMVIDLTRCFGCHACEVACKIANNNPAELDYNRVHTVAGTGQTDPVIRRHRHSALIPTARYALPMQCQHCENAPCVEACPTGATQKDPETGVVWVDEQQCIGCEACMTACSPTRGCAPTCRASPRGTLTWSWARPTRPATPATRWRSAPSAATSPPAARVPAHAACPAMPAWGDLDDPESEVSQLVASRESIRLKEDAGTNPSVYYLV